MAERINNDLEDTSDELRLDPDKLSENELEELARLVVKKLRESMQRERDRTGGI